MILKVVLYTQKRYSYLGCLASSFVLTVYVYCVPWQDDNKTIKQLCNFELHVAKIVLPKVIDPLTAVIFSNPNPHPNPNPNQAFLNVIHSLTYWRRVVMKGANYRSKIKTTVL